MSEVQLLQLNIATERVLVACEFTSSFDTLNRL